jgi:tRNA threonylcarbamoyladenosine biosynthesis protein TsaB
MNDAPLNAGTILALDTSGPRLQLALQTNGITTSLVENVARGHAEILFDRLAGFLHRNALTYRDLTRIAVTTGPGSFTGLRIGISAARGLALALDIDIVGVPNLLAISLGGSPGPLHVILDARREQAYVQKFLGPGQPESAPRVTALNGAEKLGSISKTPTLRDPRVDMGLLVAFAAGVDSRKFLPAPTYVRAADAKPQTKMRVALQ